MAADLVSLLAEGRRRYADQPIFGVKAGGSFRWTTYAQFADVVSGCAARLAALGIGAGERVVIAGPWSLHAAQLAHAVCHCRASFVALSGSPDLATWHFALRSMEPRLAFASTTQAARALEALTRETPELALPILDLPDTTPPLPLAAAARPPHADDVASYRLRRGRSGELLPRPVTHRSLCRRANSLRFSAQQRRRTLGEILLLRELFFRA